MIRLKEEYQNFRGLEEAYIIKVTEGNGTPESPIRVVIYIFDKHLVEIGKIDNKSECCSYNP